MQKLEITESEHSACWTQNALEIKDYANGNKGLYGYVGTPDGYVEVSGWLCIEKPSRSHTTLFFRINAKQYRISYNRFYSNRYVVTLAKDFALQCTTKER